MMRGHWELRGKRVILTGASQGIGAALAEALARKGARLVLAARAKDALDGTVARCRSLGAEAHAVATDVAEEPQCRALVEETVRRLGGVDLVINNAGISMWARFEEVKDLSLFERIMRVNYLGAVYLTHHALPHLRQSGGLLVAVSSLTGKTGVPTRSGYAASKHAMQGFFDSLRVELLGSGVDVLVLSPGFVATDIRARALGGDGSSRGESPRDEARGTMSVEECVRIMLRAIERREREVVMVKGGRWALAAKLALPALVDRIAARAVREKGE